MMIDCVIDGFIDLWAVVCDSRCAAVNQINPREDALFHYSNAAHTVVSKITLFNLVFVSFFLNLYLTMPNC